MKFRTWGGLCYYPVPQKRLVILRNYVRLYPVYEEDEFSEIRDWWDNLKKQTALDAREPAHPIAAGPQDILVSGTRK